MPTWENVNETHDDVAARKRKGSKKHLKRFVDEADDVSPQIGNGTFNLTMKEFKDKQSNQQMN